ncbi:hypothetical protein ACU686_36300 [Yinghuangia aomiensis]
MLQFAFVIAGLQACMGVLGPVVAKADLGGAPAWSAVLIGQALGTFAGVFLAIRIRPRRTLFVATLAVLLVPLPFLLLGLGRRWRLVVAGAFVTGAAFDVFGVLWETTMQREIPREAAVPGQRLRRAGIVHVRPAGAGRGPRRWPTSSGRAARWWRSPDSSSPRQPAPCCRPTCGGSGPVPRPKRSPDPDLPPSRAPGRRHGRRDCAPDPGSRPHPDVAAALSPQSGSAHSSPQSSG